jgi:hypothetical protein
LSVASCFRGQLSPGLAANPRLYSHSKLCLRADDDRSHAEARWVGGEEARHGQAEGLGEGCERGEGLDGDEQSGAGGAAGSGGEDGPRVEDEVRGRDAEKRGQVESGLAVFEPLGKVEGGV